MSKKKSLNDKKFETKAIREQVQKTSQKEHSVPIFATSSFTFDNAEEARAKFADELEGNIYSRFSNPNNDEFVRKMCLLEGAEDGVSTATGMASIYLALTSYLKPGDHIVSSRSVFGSTHQIITNILPKWGISHSYVDIADNEAWEEAIMPQTRMLFAETPSNPGLDLCDLKFLGDLAEKNNLMFIVDNCFATPYLQRPLEFGAHISCHSATKFIDGQGRVLGGIVVGSKEIIKEIKFQARQTGPAMSPFNGWLLSKSLETLAVRMDRHCYNAEKLAHYLLENAESKQVKYPFLTSHSQYDLAKQQMSAGGGLVTFELKGGIERCRKFLDNIQMLSLTSNLGDTRTTITHPATTTHSKLTEEERLATGVNSSLIRVSVGLEHIDDIIDDIEQAIHKSYS